MPKLPDKFINWSLIGEPLNWAVIFATATIWLLAFHVIMKGFTAMQGTQGAFSPGPGLVAAQSTSTGNFSQAGSAGPSGQSGNGWWGGGISMGDGTWTDGYDAQWATDGWDGNP
jgi:hypothetical protein